MSSHRESTTPRQASNSGAGSTYSHSRPPTMGQYIPTGPANRPTPYNTSNVPGDYGMHSLANAMGALNFQAQYHNGQRQHGTTSDYNGMPSVHGQLYVPQQPGYLFMPPQNGMPQGSTMYHQMTPYPSPAGYGMQNQHMEHSPVGQSWTPRLHGSDMPSLITPSPRESVSSNEVELPGTPYTGYGTYGGVTTLERSPSHSFNQSTGTPSPLGPNFNVPHLPKPMPPVADSVPLHLQMLVQQEPAIPRAIPAPMTAPKPLDRSLENKNGETNVYIRGLLPETTDEMLHAWGARFGDIQSSKSIIDMKNGLCKGFGFIKYHNYDDAGQCIRGFYYLGYEVSFARESFYSKLKKFSDETNTNLYVSNIPKNLNEHELSAIFKPIKVCSSRILRDHQGNGRGVGFARFESREICEQIIHDFNNYPVTKQGEDEEHLIQIRYSDTQEQKMLKQQTAAARTYRADEFEAGVMYARGRLMAGSLSAYPQYAHANGDDFEQYLTQNTGQSAHGESSAANVTPKGEGAESVTGNNDSSTHETHMSDDRASTPATEVSPKDEK